MSCSLIIAVDYRFAHAASSLGVSQSLASADSLRSNPLEPSSGFSRKKRTKSYTSRCRASGRFSTSLLISSCVLIGRSLSHDSLWMKAISWAYAKSDRRCTHETAERCARPDMKDAAITAVCLRPSPTASTSPLCFSRQTVKQIVPVIDDIRAFGETAPEHWDVAFCLG